MIRRLVVVMLIMLLGAGGYLAWAWSLHLQPGRRIYVVRPGTTLHAFASELHRQGAIPDTWSLLLLAHLEGQTRGLQAGEYEFHAGITLSGLLAQVVSGKTVQYPLTLVDGWTFRQVMQAVNAAPKLRHSLAGLTTAQIAARLGHPGANPEGCFYPDTYYYTNGTSDVSLLRHAYQRMRQFVLRAWPGRARGLPLRDPYQALILASLVERETAAPVERPLIAGVFVNRLRLGMKLQTDPAVIYGMGSRYHGAIHISDLRRDTPYNTYRHYGLPPTPIALPSPQSIMAALHPATTKALYFVSRGNGTHQFSETLKQQDEAVIKYELHGHRRRGTRVAKKRGKR
ncbi:MAG TPA: endolytic transglycosylase MltG [Acidiferrobacteraceae bacterium]|nr:endolytic transglycosylase MltG [Acidiferrobacteraceae bacterium]